MVVRHLNPFRDQVAAYQKSNWRGTLPLPYKEKHPPPDRINGTIRKFIGGNADPPTKQELEIWHARTEPHNICVRMLGCSLPEDIPKYEIVGIDIDHYEKGGKDKKGGDQLVELEKKYGPLPDTWIATSRTDGISGIRFFRVPVGLAFRGKAHKDIDIISRGNRFAVVWPSIHPTGEMYWWFPPGVKPTEEGRKAWDKVIPDARTLPALSDEWANFLTQGGLKFDPAPMDMDSSVNEINKWAENTFLNKDNLCGRVAKSIPQQKKRINDHADNHAHAVAFHWHFLSLAFESHTGWEKAIRELEAHYLNDVLKVKNGKRGWDEAHHELFRSYSGALRKIKAASDKRVEEGQSALKSECAGDKCGSRTGLTIPMTVAKSDDGEPPSETGDIPGHLMRHEHEYRTHDDDNAAHLIHMFSTASNGPSFKWINGYGWIIWHGSDNPHWERDQEGNQIIRRMWHKVKERQERYVEGLQIQYDIDLQTAITTNSANPGQIALTRNNTPSPGTFLAQQKAGLEKWRKWAEDSGNNYRAENAIKAARSRFQGIKMDINELDANPRLLGVANGVVELSREFDQVRLRPAQMEDYVLLNTNVPWEEPTQRAQQLWNNYLEAFLPDEDFRKVVQVILGHGILGGNPHKAFIVLHGGTDTGKSTMINCIQSALGEYCGTVDETMLQGGHFKEMLIDSAKKRFAVASEFGTDAKLSSAVIKRFTGGTDKVSSAIKNSMAIAELDVHFLLVLATNKVPTITGADKALANRARCVIPFKHKPRYIDQHLGDAMVAACKTAVLDWLIQGYIEYAKLGYLPTHSDIEEASRLFVSELDEVANFAYDMLDPHPNMDADGVRWQDQPEWCIQVGKLYERFEAWWTRNVGGERDRPGPTKFARALQGHGYLKTQIRPPGGRSDKYWVGVKIQSGTNVVVATNRFRMITEKTVTGNTSGNNETPGQPI